MTNAYPIPVLGLAAWSGAGKTTLLRGVLPILRERGVRCALVKHAHHSFDIDHPGKDSYELRKAGADQVLIASRKRWALMVEHEHPQDPPLSELLGHLDARQADVVLIEGFRHESLPKIEVHRPALGKPLLHPDDPRIIAVACDQPLNTSLPQLDLNNPVAVASFIIDFHRAHRASRTAQRPRMQANTCDTKFDPIALTEEQARARILEAATPVNQSERKPLPEALGRVLASPVEAPFDVPPHRNSAMDGYALRGAEQSIETTLKIVGRSFAGHPFQGRLGAGECVHIMTGAVVPEGADTVVQQELTEADGDQLRLRQVLKTGANIRHPGEDLRQSQTVLEAGRVLTPSDLGLLASLGLGEIDVRRLPRVAFFSTGDELRGIGEPLGEGDIYDSNRYVLNGLLRNIGVEILDLGRIPDRAEAVHEALRKAAAQADLVLTTGGASVGEADYVTDALRELGQAEFWKLAIKPGRPLNFGRIGNTLFFGLPGNPVSAMVTFSLFVAPCLRRQRGEADRPYRILKAVSRDTLKKSPGRADFQRGILHTEPDGSLSVSTTGLQGSHVLSSMSRADCFIRLPRESGPLEAGSAVDVIAFKDLF